MWFEVLTAVKMCSAGGGSMFFQSVWVHAQDQAALQPIRKFDSVFSNSFKINVNVKAPF
jgi:hypothetical protein